jgi:hypothetical protein
MEKELEVWEGLSGIHCIKSKMGVKKAALEKRKIELQAIRACLVSDERMHMKKAIRLFRDSAMSDQGAGLDLQRFMAERLESVISILDESPKLRNNAAVTALGLSARDSTCRRDESISYEIESRIRQPEKKGKSSIKTAIYSYMFDHPEIDLGYSRIEQIYRDYRDIWADGDDGDYWSEDWDVDWELDKT